MFEWLSDRIEAVRGTAVAKENDWQFLLNPAASEEEIARCEQALHLPLPPSYRAFLRRSDGASFFRREVRLPDGRTLATMGLEIAGTGRLPELNARLRAERAEPRERWGRLIMAGDAPLGEGDLWGLNPDTQADGEYAVVDGWHEQGPYCWRQAVIASSFEAWLRRAFDEALATGNPWYWAGSPELQAIYDACNAEEAALPPVPPVQSSTVGYTVARAIGHVETGRYDG